MGELSPDDISTTDHFFMVRPNVEKFIEMNILVGNDVAIWSCGSKHYVDTIIGSLFHSQFKFVWNREKCECGGHQKNLLKVIEEFPEYRKKDLIFYDNNDGQINFNRKLGFFCVDVPDFIFGDDEDDFFP